MHILFLTDNFPPESNAPASRTYEHAREWVAAGHKVTVITCAPNFPQGKVYKGYRNRLWQSEMMDGIRVIRVWSFMSKNEGFVLRTLDYQSYMLTSFFASLFVRRPDVIIGTSPQFFTAVAAWAAAGFKRCPFVFELRDLWPESIRAVSGVSKSRLLDWAEKLELFLYRRADMIVSVTHAFKRDLMVRGTIDEAKIKVVTNGVDSTRFSPTPKDAELLQYLQLTGMFVAGYVGTHGMAHGLDALLDAAALLQADPETADIRILFVGDGARRAELIARAEEMGLTNVIFQASVPKSEVVRYWSLLDMSIIHLRRTDLFKTVIPSKMFECFGMGLPILLGVAGEAADILSSVGAGVTVEPENAVEIAAALKAFKADPAARADLSEKGLTGVKRYDRRILAAAMLSHLETLAEERER